MFPAKDVQFIGNELWEHHIMNRKREASRVAEAEETTLAAATNPSAQRILVVDDDASVREMLTRVLAGEGYLVWAAADGMAAMEIAAAAKFDLVLLDLNLPGKSGWDTFEALTARDPLLAVIIITARSNQFLTAQGAGAAALLEKPLDFTTLLKTVSRLLAENAAARLKRITGHSTEFQYLHRTKPK
jgi:DNA-binding response OmpR family regulator